MRTLPAIDTGARRWRLPAADHTALQLADAVLTEEGATRVELLETAVANDPALALWCVCFPWQTTRVENRSVRDAAAWLDRKGIESIAAAKHDRVDDAAPWLACLTESIRRQSSAQKVFAREGGRCEDTLAAIVSNIREWLAVGGSKKSRQRGELESIAPPWLVEIADSYEVAAIENADDNSATWARLVRPWQVEHAPAWPLLAKACRLRRRLRERERQTEEHLRREKLAALKEFTYGASHELNNPLFNISSRAQMLLRDEQDPQRRRKLSTIYAHAMRASEMINDIALAARPPAPEFGDVDAIALVQEVVRELQPLAEEQATDMKLTVHNIRPPLPIEADAIQLAIAVREVCINALEALKRSTRRGELSVTVAQPDAATIEIIVADNGPGLDARAKRHLFDPFFSGYESGRGLGFGLTKCWQIVDAHGGSILVDSQADRGSQFTLRLPAKHPARATAGEAEAASPG